MYNKKNNIVILKQNDTTLKVLLNPSRTELVFINTEGGEFGDTKKVITGDIHLNELKSYFEKKEKNA